MSIEALVNVTLARVDVAEDYRIELHVHDVESHAEAVTSLTWTEAEQLAAELLAAVAQARGMLAEDFPVENFAALAGFDIAPTCRDCSEGKHAACIGSAFVERGPDIDEVECGCAKAGHPDVQGSAA